MPLGKRVNWSSTLDFAKLADATLEDQWEVTKAAADAVAKVEAAAIRQSFGQRTGQLASSVTVKRKVYTRGALRGAEHAIVSPDYEHKRAGGYTGTRHTPGGAHVYARSKHGTMTKGTNGSYSGTNMEIAAILHFGTHDGRLKRTLWADSAERAAKGPAVAAAKTAYRQWLKGRIRKAKED